MEYKKGGEMSLVKTVFNPIICFAAILFLTQDLLSAMVLRGDANTDGHRVVDIGELVTLDGSTSVIEGKPRLSYIWTFVSKPTGSQAELFSIDEPHR